MDAQNVNPLHTTKIVGSYLRNHRVGASELPHLITTVHRSLSELGLPTPVEQVLTPAVSVRQSVRHDYVVCLDCGHRGRTLRRHISHRHGLSRDEYLRRWGLQPRPSPDGPGLFRASIYPGKTIWSGSQTKGRGGGDTHASGITRGRCRGESRGRSSHLWSGHARCCGSSVTANAEEAEASTFSGCLATN